MLFSCKWVANPCTGALKSYKKYENFWKLPTEILSHLVWYELYYSIIALVRVYLTKNMFSILYDDKYKVMIITSSLRIILPDGLWLQKKKMILNVTQYVFGLL